MYSVPQIEPVTTMARNHKLLLEKLENGPVYLTQRGSEAAVVVSMQEWRTISSHLEELEALRRQARLERSNLAYAQMQANPSQVVDQTEYEQMLATAGLSA